MQSFGARWFTGLVVSSAGVSVLLLIAIAYGEADASWYIGSLITALVLGVFYFLLEKFRDRMRTFWTARGYEYDAAPESGAGRRLHLRWVALVLALDSFIFIGVLPPIIMGTDLTLSLVLASAVAVAAVGCTFIVTRISPADPDGNRVIW